MSDERPQVNDTPQVGDSWWQSNLAGDISHLSEDETRATTIKVFGHLFEDIPQTFAEELITLEREGAIYSNLWDDETEMFRYYRIRLRPPEVFEFVEAMIEYQRFNAAIMTMVSAKGFATLEDGLAGVASPEVRERVRNYDIDFIDGVELDIRGCPASFYSRELEALLLFKTPLDRLELLPDISSDRDQFGLLMAIINAFPTVAGVLGDRARDRPNFVIANEYDVQDLLFAALKGAFIDARREEWAPSVAGSHKRIDIVVPTVGTVVETKFVRDANHARRIGDELKIDIESYHSHPACQRLVALVFDPHRHVADPEGFSHDLSGLRIKGTTSFNVEVLIRR